MVEVTVRDPERVASASRGALRSLSLFAFFRLYHQTTVPFVYLLRLVIANFVLRP